MAGHRPERGNIAGDRNPRTDRTWPSIGTVVATPAAVDAILRLRVRHHMIAFHPTDGHHDTGGPNFLAEAELPPKVNELQLGEIGGVPFLVDADQYKRWGCPDLVVDVPEGDDESALAGRDRGCGLTLRAFSRNRTLAKRDQRVLRGINGFGDEPVAKSAVGSVVGEASSKWVFGPMAGGRVDGEDHRYDYDRTDADHRP